jgi:multidrug efflux pump
MMIVFVLLVALVVWMFTRLPASFLPNEDQGYLIVNVQLPPGATQGRTLEVMQQVRASCSSSPVQSMVSVMGFSFRARARTGWRSCR